MEYTINKLAKLAGLSTRTLRWYDECGLLKPERIQENGYRIYGQAELDRLQQILFYRELGVALSEIGRILESEDFDIQRAMEAHIQALYLKKEQLDRLITNAEKSIRTMRGETTMSDHEKFEGFKQKLIADNEKQYGDEIRATYGDETIDSSNTKLGNMTQAQYDEAQRLEREIGEALKAAMKQGDPAGELAQKACQLHREWLCHYWDSYSPEAHRGLARMYVDDPRFAAYYDKIAPGCAVFLRDAIEIYCP